MKVRAFAMVLCGMFLAASAPRAETVSVLYSFCSIEEGGTCLDGEYPSGGLIQGSDGNFYGTTYAGGAGTSILYGFTGSGTVFKLTPTGTLTTLYSFCIQSECTDGAIPNPGLIQGSDGNFYGTTGGGGTGYDPFSGLAAGTVFKLTPTGTLTTLYSFCSQSGCTDGMFPSAGLIQASDGNFYGTTAAGGANIFYGTVFKLTPTGTLTTLYSFCSQSGCADGSTPYAGLIQAINGDFYGTTFSGGTNGITGTVFKLTPAGTLTTLYPFPCRKRDRDNFCLDGENPVSGLIQASNGNFYGTTIHGGTYGNGNVFRLTPGGTLTSLCSKTNYNGNCTDGQHPSGLNQASDGNLYGTTLTGGTANQGNIFQLTPSGTPTILYSFCSQSECADGAFPDAGLIQASNGNLYGTANLAGAHGGGTVFTLSLPTTVSVSPAQLNFGKVNATVTSKTKKLTLNNKGDEPATTGQLSVPAFFTITGDTCSNITLASKEQCTVEVAFAPASPIGNASETLAIPYNGTSPTETLTGDGIAVSLSSPKSKTLASTAAGTISKAENITIKNETEATVAVGSPSTLTDFKIASDSCAGATLAPRNKCVVSVEFAPALDASGTLTDTLSYGFTYGSNSGNVAVALTGKVVMAH